MPDARPPPSSTVRAQRGAVVLNYRLAAAALETARHLATHAKRVVVVDGASGDGSADVLRALVPGAAPVRVPGGTLRVEGAYALLELDENRGYTGGHNAGIRTLLSLDDPSVIVLMNANSRVPSAAVEEGIELLQEPGVGVVGWTYQLGPFPRFHHPLHWGMAGLRQRYLRPGVSRLAAAPGWAMAVHVECLQDVVRARGDFFREDLFMYWDELELGWTVRRLGWAIRGCHLPGIARAHGESIARVTVPLREYYNKRNVWLVARSLHPLRGAWIAGIHSAYAVAEIGIHHVRGDVARRRAVWQGLRDGFANRGGRWAGQT